MIRLLSCSNCTLQQPVENETTDTCVRCGKTSWIDFPTSDTTTWPADEPKQWPTDPADGQTLYTVSTLWRYDGHEWVPAGRRPRGPRP